MRGTDSGRGTESALGDESARGAGSATGSPRTSRGRSRPSGSGTGPPAAGDGGDRGGGRVGRLQVLVDPLQADLAQVPRRRGAHRTGEPVLQAAGADRDGASQARGRPRLFGGGGGQFDAPGG